MSETHYPEEGEVIEALEVLCLGLERVCAGESQAEALARILGVTEAYARRMLQGEIKLKDYLRAARVLGVKVTFEGPEPLNPNHDLYLWVRWAVYPSGVEVYRCLLSGVQAETQCGGVPDPAYYRDHGQPLAPCLWWDQWDAQIRALASTKQEILTMLLDRATLMAAVNSPSREALDDEVLGRLAGLLKSYLGLTVPADSIPVREAVDAWVRAFQKEQRRWDSELPWNALPPGCWVAWDAPLFESYPLRLVGIATSWRIADAAPHGHLEQFTCLGCPKASTCPWAFDTRNTQGECVATDSAKGTEE